MRRRAFFAAVPALIVSLSIRSVWDSPPKFETLFMSYPPLMQNGRRNAIARWSAQRNGETYGYWVRCDPRQVGQLSQAQIASAFPELTEMLRHVEDSF